MALVGLPDNEVRLDRNLVSQKELPRATGLSATELCSVNMLETKLGQDTETRQFDDGIKYVGDVQQFKREL